MTKPLSRVIKKIDIGSGMDKIEGYLTVDLYEKADIKDDIRTLKKFGEASIDEVRAFHVLEHVYERDVSKALDSIHRVLMPGGKLFLEVPDLEWLLQDWLDTPEDGRWGFKLQTIFGLQRPENPGETHFTGFTARRLSKLLMNANFSNLKVDIIPQKDTPHNQQVIRVEATKL